MKRYLYLPLFVMLLIGCAAPAEPKEAAPVVIEEEVAATVEAVIEPTAQPTRESSIDPTLIDQIPDYVSAELPNVNSVIILDNGETIFEQYWNRRSVDSAETVFSVTKSIVSTLIGIAIDEGAIESVDQTVGDYLSDQISSEDERLADITIHQLLTMNSGIYCSGDSCYDHSLFDTLGKKLSAAPGESFVYDTGASHLLSGILQEAVGMTAEEYAQQRLFDPLEFDNLKWSADPEGYSFGGVGISMRPRDMANFGQLFLNDGEWNGTQLVSAEYIAEATQSQISPSTEEVDYGYLWWIPRHNDPVLYQAVGFGGQYVTVIPDHELVIVITTSVRGGSGANNSYDIVRNFIFPGLK